MAEDIYNQAIIETARRAPRGGRLATPGGTATIDNPLCGDRVTIDLTLRDGRIADLAHRVRGCTLCDAAGAG